MAAQKWPLILRHWLQWQNSTSRNGPRTVNRTAPHKQPPEIGVSAIACPPATPASTLSCADLSFRLGFPESRDPSQAIRIMAHHDVCAHDRLHYLNVQRTGNR